MNVVLYMRYSSDMQTEQSIEGQDRVCTEYCLRNGYTIIHKYIDRATSAYKHTEKRLQFNQMIKDAEKQKFEAVVVYKLDRFARNRYDSAISKAKLAKSGVKVLSATEGISDSPEGVILESVLEGMAEYYSMELAQKVRRGQKESEAKGNHLGPVPFGYKVVNKKLVIDEQQAQIVREAFDLYTNGATRPEVAKTLNDKGYRTAKGQPFTKNSFSNMFRNERYLGVYLHADTRIEGGIPAIIDRDTFEAAQIVRKKNAGTPGKGKAKVKYLLSGKLFCGHCGSTMVGESGHSHTGAVYYYYACQNRKKHKSCDKRPVAKEWIENLVAEDAKKLLTPENIEIIANAAEEEEQKRLGENSKLPGLQSQLTETVNSINNLILMIEKGLASDSVIGRIEALEERKKQLETEIAIEEGKQFAITKEQIVWWLNRFVSEESISPYMVESLIDALVQSVTIWDEPDGKYRITVKYNITGDTSEQVESSDIDGDEPVASSNPNLFIRNRVLVHTFYSRP